MAQTKEQEAEKTLPWDKIATSAGAVGLIITFVPYFALWFCHRSWYFRT